MGDNDEVLRKLDGIAELLENLIILEAMKANIAGGSVRKLIGVDTLVQIRISICERKKAEHLLA